MTNEWQTSGHCRCQLLLENCDEYSGDFHLFKDGSQECADVAKPLNAGVKGKPRSKLRWTVEMHNAFRRMKQLVAEATALKIPDHNKEFKLITDCSDKGAGAVLTQEENGSRIPVTYFHHTLTPAETRYTTTDKELLAVVLSIRKFRVYLTKRFNLITDHQAVLWLTGMNIHDERRRRGRWIEFLQNFDIQFIHRSGQSPELSLLVKPPLPNKMQKNNAHLCSRRA